MISEISDYQLTPEDYNRNKWKAVCFIGAILWAFCISFFFAPPLSDLQLFMFLGPIFTLYMFEGLVDLCAIKDEGYEARDRLDQIVFRLVTPLSAPDGISSDTNPKVAAISDVPLSEFQSCCKTTFSGLIPGKWTLNLLVSLLGLCAVLLVVLFSVHDFVLASIVLRILLGSCMTLIVYTYLYWVCVARHEARKYSKDGLKRRIAELVRDREMRNYLYRLAFVVELVVDSRKAAPSTVVPMRERRQALPNQGIQN